MIEILDINGRLIEVGDTIAWANTHVRGSLQQGVVQKIWKSDALYFPERIQAGDHVLRTVKDRLVIVKKVEDRGPPVGFVASRDGHGQREEE